MSHTMNMFESGKLTHPDGRMHHLGINESEITHGVILTSNLERTKIIADTFDKAEKTGEYREYITYKGEKHGVPMSVMSVGMGCMPTAIAVEELRHVGCTNMIKVGTCGAIQPDIKPGTIIIPTGAVRGEGATIEYINLQYPAATDMDVLFAITDSAKEMGTEAIQGVVRTHDAIFLESLFAHDGMEERIRPWRELGVLGIENEIASMLTVASVIGSKAGAVLLVADNYVTGETLDFEREYDPLMRTVIEIATRAMAKLEKK
ncbi:MAG: nucleoside phosphorylase [Oscillospiraceae bacterium]|nr:nucleoside phosphorylase [Oscillospiraceae bacterium]